MVHDAYYNTHLTHFSVGDGAPIEVEPLQSRYLHSYYSNSIIDSGCSFMMLTAQLHQHFIQILTEQHPQLLSQYQHAAASALKLKGIPLEQVDLSQWPSLHFTLAGEQGAVTLELPPQYYWQFNAPEVGQAMMMLQAGIPKWANQSILGLPLMNNYYCVFDRDEGETGVIKFAKRALPPF